MATKKATKNIGDVMIAKLRALHKNDPKAGLTTEELAKFAKCSVKDAYSRAYWLSIRDGILSSTGKGKERCWRLNAKGVKATEPPTASA